MPGLHRALLRRSSTADRSQRQRTGGALATSRASCRSRRTRHHRGRTTTITAPQAAAVVSDVAAVTQALVVLDRRYHRVPGWTTLHRGRPSGWTALAAALDVNLNPPDFTSTQPGWQPRVRADARPRPSRTARRAPGRAQTCWRTRTRPTRTRLRFVAGLANAFCQPVSARSPDGPSRSASTTGTLAPADTPSSKRHLRDIGGVRGGGERAAAEAANVVARLRAVPSDTIVEPRTLAGFTMLAERIDDRIAAVVEQGITRGDYVQRVTLPRLDVDAGQLVQRLARATEWCRTRTSFRSSTSPDS